jgi:hypothetical protein
MPNTPAVPGTILIKGEPENHLREEEMSTYRSGVGKLLHLMKWSRPEILNSVRELSKFMSGAIEGHKQAMYRVMKYCVNTANRGLLLKPNKIWDGNPDFEFVITGLADSEYAKDPETRRSVGGHSTFLCEAPVTTKSKMQNCVTMSVTEAELVSACHCAQDMLFQMRVIESMGLKVEKPMILKVDNKGAKDLAHNWSTAGRTRHVDVRYHFLRELKEEGLIRVEWFSSEENGSDLFTKNLPGPLFERHTRTYCGQDEYMKSSNDSQGKGVPGDFVSPGPFHMSTSSYDYKDTSAVNIESPVTSAINCEGLKADKCVNAVNIDGHEEGKWIVVRNKKNGSTINYLLETE